MPMVHMIAASCLRKPMVPLEVTGCCTGCWGNCMDGIQFTGCTFAMLVICCFIKSTVVKKSQNLLR
jgi:hypothetical protein